jgi:hypothetical protein
MMGAVGANLCPEIKTEKYEIYCPAAGGPVGVPNMTRASCERRQDPDVGFKQCQRCKGTGEGITIRKPYAVQKQRRPCDLKAAILAARRRNPEMSNREIADHVGCHKSTVGRIFAIAGIGAEDGRKCPWCGAQIKRREDETVSNFKKRQYCNQRCASRHRSAQRSGNNPDNKANDEA